MTTREVADYLRLKERKIYDLVATGRIPCTRVSGKWLFPRELVDRWLLSGLQGESVPDAALPPVVVGSHDPLLEWALQASGIHYAVLFDGSLDGLERFLKAEASFCGMHALDGSGEYNVPLIARRAAAEPLVVLQWAHRQQGLMLPPHNPYGVTDLASALSLRWGMRQQGAGSYLLLKQLLAEQGETRIHASQTQVCSSETALASAVANGRVDVGLGVQAAAAQMGLHFVPLVRERYDLVIWRKAYFEPAFQRFWQFVQSPAFRQQAHALSGYDLSAQGTVHFNGG